MVKKIKWGIIGPGDIAQQFVRDLNLLRNPRIISAVLGKPGDSLNQFVDNFQPTKIFHELEAFVDKAEVDIVYIATPHTFHYEEALACLKKGIPMLCEKPVTLEEEQCRTLVDTARQNEVFFMEAMWIRFLPSIRLLLKIIEGGRIGNITSIKASIGFKAPYDPGSRFYNRELGGGSLPDLGIYPIFLAYLLLGKPDTIKAIGTISDTGVDESCSILFNYNKGQHAVLESSNTSDSNSPAEITGEKGVIRILEPWFEKTSGLELHVFDDGKIVYPCSWEGHGLQFEAGEALSCLENKQIESNLLPHSFSLGMQAIMEEVRSQIHVEYPVS